ncbi:MAG: hypothetical protein ABI693_14275 [Bryobacteraceae bacterium]
MKSVALSFALFVLWSVLGVGFLTAFYSRRNLLRNLLLAPVTGASLVLLFVFWINRLGIPVGRFGRPLWAALLVVSLGLLWFRRKRPIIPFRRTAPFVFLLIASFFLSGFPMLEFGTNWLSYGNDDMSNYVLGATRFHDFGYFDIPDTKVFSANRDAALHYWFMHVPDGFRSGAELTISSVMALTGIDGLRIFMPLIFALNMALIAAGAALVLTSRKRRLAAVVATALMAGCALLTLGVLYQLIAQVLGMALLAAGAAVLMKPLSRPTWRGRRGDASVIGVLLAALAITYPEIVPFLVLGFLAWNALAFRQMRSSLPMWILAAIVVLLCINTYLPDSVAFLRYQAGTGARGASRTETLFPFYMVPSGLANLWSLLGVAQRNTPMELNLKIVTGLLLTLLFGWLTFHWMRRKEPVALMASLMLAIGVTLFFQDSNFGLYKLAMFIQPFLAGTMALAIASQRDWKPWVAAAVLFGFSLQTQNFYVERSRGTQSGLVEVPGASQSHLIDEIRHLAIELPANARFTSDTANLVVAKIQSMYLRQRPLEFYCRDFFPQFRYGRTYAGTAPPKHGTTDPQLEELATRTALTRLNHLTPALFDMENPAEPRDEFLFNSRATMFPGDEPQYLLASTYRLGILNRRTLGAEDANIKPIPMKDVRNHLAFVSSSLGQIYYLNDRRHAAFFQLEADLAYPGRTVASTGRNILMRVLNPTPGGRLLLDFTSSWNSDGDNSLPPAEVVGAGRFALPLRGRGAARVFSAPVTPQRLNGQDYIDLDMGREGKTFDGPRSGLMAIYGRDVLIDTRWLTGFARNISYISEEEYRNLKPPTGVWKFPEGLLAKDLEYSGVYEDGWVSEDSAFTLVQTPDRPELVISGWVPKVGATAAPDVVMTVDGVEVGHRTLPNDDFEWRVPVAYREGRREVSLKFSNRRSLPSPDNRPVSAKLRSIGFEGAPLLTEDITTKDSNVTLGRGWYTGEKLNGQVFRWVDNDAMFHTDQPVELDMEPGPGVKVLPAQVDITSSNGVVLSRKLAARQKVVLKPGSYKLHIANGGAPTPADSRTLNLRVFRFAPVNSTQADIALSGVWLGNGWFGVETQNGRRFRWADTNSEFGVKGPGRLRVEVEPGPSLAASALQLKIVDAAGHEVNRVDVPAHRKVNVDIPANGMYRFVVDSPRRAVPNDPRVLNFRVWELSLQAP